MQPGEYCLLVVQLRGTLSRQLSCSHLMEESEDLCGCTLEFAPAEARRAPQRMCTRTAQHTQLKKEIGMFRFSLCMAMYSRTKAILLYIAH